MAEPRDPNHAYTPIADAFVTAGAPITDRLRTALDDNIDHGRETIYDPDIHTAALAHAHRGDESSHLFAMPSTPNLLAEGFIMSLQQKRWVRHGVTADATGMHFSSGNQWASHALVDADRPPHSRTVLGRRCDLVASLYLKATGTLTAGVMAMGLTDGGKDKEDDAKTFVAGTRVLIPYTVIGTSWMRVWAVLPGGGQFDKAVRFVVQCEESLQGGSVAVNLVDVRPGRMLDFYTHGYHTDDYLGWFGFGSTSGPPPFDQVIAFDNAVELAPLQE
jgi:hypothetical protein